MEYGIGTSNRYAFLNEGEDPAASLETKGKENEKAPSLPVVAKKTPLPAAPAFRGNDKTSGQGTTDAANKNMNAKSDAKKMGPGGGQQGGHSGPRADRPLGQKRDPNQNNQQGGGGSRAPRGGDRAGAERPAGERPRGPPKGDRVIRSSNDQRREGGEGGFQRREGGEGGGYRGERREGGEGGFQRRDGERRDFVDRRNRRNQEGGEPRPLGQNNTGFSVERSGEDGGYRPRGDRPFRGGDRPRGGFRGRGRGSYDGRGKREFDRHSGNDKTGIKPTEKREGSGSHNWGTVEDDIAAQVEGQAPETLDRSAEGVDQGPTEGDATEPANAEPAEEEPKLLTLEEYKQLEQQDTKRIQPKFNLRKPGEGEDKNQWKKTYLLEKTKDEEESEYEEIIVEEPVKNKNKIVLDIDIKWAGRDGAPSRGGGRGRGGPRGDRGGRGGYRDGEDRGYGRREGGEDRYADRREGGEGRGYFRRDGEEGGRGGYRGNRDGEEGGRGGYRGNRDGEEGRGYRNNREGEEGGRGGYRGNREGGEGRGGYRGNRDGGEGRYAERREGGEGRGEFRGPRDGGDDRYKRRDDAGEEGGERADRPPRIDRGFDSKPRGGPGRGAGAGRGGRPAPKVDDLEAFPALDAA